MLRKLEIQIECGETTCASAPGEFCKYLRQVRFGTTPICKLFSDHATAAMGSGKTRWEELSEKDGWVQRHRTCLQLEKK